MVKLYGLLSGEGESQSRMEKKQLVSLSNEVGIIASFTRVLHGFVVLLLSARFLANFIFMSVGEGELRRDYCAQ